GVEDDGARLGLGSPAALVPEPPGVGDRPRVAAELVGEPELVAQPRDEHVAPGGLLVAPDRAAVARDGLLGAGAGHVPLVVLGLAVGVLLDADLRPCELDGLLGGGTGFRGLLVRAFGLLPVRSFAAVTAVVRLAAPGVAGPRPVPRPALVPGAGPGLPGLPGVSGPAGGRPVLGRGAAAVAGLAAVRVGGRHRRGGGAERQHRRLRGGGGGGEHGGADEHAAGRAPSDGELTGLAVPAR